MPDEIPSKKERHLDEGSKEMWDDFAKTEDEVCKEDAETLQCCLDFNKAVNLGLVTIMITIPRRNGITVKTVKLNYCPECGTKLWHGK